MKIYLFLFRGFVCLFERSPDCIYPDTKMDVALRSPSTNRDIWHLTKDHQLTDCIQLALWKCSEIPQRCFHTTVEICENTWNIIEIIFNFRWCISTPYLKNAFARFSGLCLRPNYFCFRFAIFFPDTSSGSSNYRRRYDKLS